MAKEGKLFVVSAPSGTGKTTLVNNVIQQLANKYNISKVVTYTTRKPRDGEKDGKDYHFVSHEEFNRKVTNGDFLETTNYADKPYASPSNIVDEMKLGKSFVLVVDREGTKSVAKNGLNPVTIWIMPPNIESLKNRILKRGTESPAQIEERISLAKQEMEEEESQRLFTYHIVNKVFDEAARELALIIENELNA